LQPYETALGVENKNMKVAINTCYGGFSLSDLAIEKLLSIKGIDFEKQENEHRDAYYYKKGFLGNNEYYISRYDFCENRSDSDLISVIEEMGEAANGPTAKLKIVEVDSTDWHIEEYDGVEHVSENHRTWS